MTGHSRMNGFSMIEAVAAVFVMSLTLLLAFTMWSSVLNSYRSHELGASSFSAAQIGIDYLSSDVRSAKVLLSSFDGCSTSASSIAIQSLSYDTSGIIPNAYDYISYQVNDDNQLTRTIVSGGGDRVNETDRVLANDADTLSFTYLCTEEFQGNGSATTFTLSHPWQENPMVMQDGTQISGFFMNPSARTITISPAPSSGSAIDVSYSVSPADSSALTDVSDVHITLTCRSTEADASRTITLDTNARLRNKR